MTAILTRRWFLIGSSAALALAAAPTAPIVASPVEPAAQIPSWTPYLHRNIIRICAGVDNPVPEVLTVNIKKQGEEFLFRSAFHSFSSFAWIAPYEGGIPVKANEVLELDITGQSTLGRIVLICVDKIDGGDPIMLCEMHKAPWTEPPTVLPLSLNDAERLEAAQHARK